MEIDATKPEGNAIHVMGYVQDLLEQVGRSDEWLEIVGRMKSGDYENLCQVAEDVTNGSIRVINRASERVG